MWTTVPLTDEESVLASATYKTAVAGGAYGLPPWAGEILLFREVDRWVLLIPYDKEADFLRGIAEDPRWKRVYDDLYPYSLLAKEQERVIKEAEAEAVRCKHVGVADVVPIVVLKCESCEELSMPEELAPLRECSKCDTRFVSEERNCPQDNSPFSRLISPDGCTKCEAGECVEAEARECSQCRELVEVEAPINTAR